tara:strand:+ start:96 stop:326 length:231 start_codon:yes stop_codon:yes gene_type:complete
MKIIKEFSASDTKGHRYPAVLIDGEGTIVIATACNTGVEFTADSVMMHFNDQDDSYWSDCGFIPASSPVTITLENE